MSNQKLKVACLFLPIGVIFSGVGGSFYYDDMELVAKGGQATGTIVALGRYRDDEGTVMYKPEVEFRDKGGALHQFTSNTSASSSAGELGGPVEVIYDPDSPADAQIDSFMYRYFLPLIFGLLGIIFILTSGALFIGHWRQT